jgi:hypothetical protein
LLGKEEEQLKNGQFRSNPDRIGKVIKIADHVAGFLLFAWQKMPVLLYL